MNHGTIIYAAISVACSAFTCALAWAGYNAPLWQAGTPFVGALLFATFAAASGWAAVHCSKL